MSSQVSQVNEPSIVKAVGGQGETESESNKSTDSDKGARRLEVDGHKELPPNTLWMIPMARCVMQPVN